MTLEAKDLPRPPFMWTLDQIAMIMSMDQDKFQKQYVYFQDLTAGPTNKYKVIARNIAPLGEHPDWRISETELLRWLRRIGYRPRYQGMY